MHTLTDLHTYALYVDSGVIAHAICCTVWACAVEPRAVLGICRPKSVVVLQVVKVPFSASFVLVPAFVQAAHYVVMNTPQPIHVRE